MNITFTHKRCKICGRDFIGRSGRRDGYCSAECKKEGMKRNDRNYQERKRERANRKPNLDKTLREIEAYNKKHGTRLSYGQYQLMRQLADRKHDLT